MFRLLKGCLGGCVVLLLLLAGGSFVIYSWFQKTYNTPLPPAPKLGPAVALRPTIVLRAGDPYAAGTAVAVRTAAGREPILLTALHLFGPDGNDNFDRPHAPEELNKLVKEIQLKPFGGGSVVARTRTVLRKKGPGLVEGESRVQFDLAVFSLAPKPKVSVQPLAEKDPKMGEWVWLVGDELKDRPQRQRLYPAQVGIVNLNGGLLRLKQPMDLSAFSGAPVVNVKGEVVGILIGGGDAGAMMNSAEGIRHRLMESRIK